jgi:hypothetical protein
MKREDAAKIAERAKADGYEVIYSIIKTENFKPLYHLMSVDIVIRFGKWIPAKVQNIPDSDGLYGVKVYKALPEKSISKLEAIRKYS